MNALSSTLAALQANDFSAIKELDQINQDIENLARYVREITVTLLNHATKNFCDV